MNKHEDHLIDAALFELCGRYFDSDVVAALIDAARKCVARVAGAKHMGEAKP